MSFNSNTLAPKKVAGKEGSAVNVGEIERLASAMAGGALAVYGLRQRSIGGLCLTLAGTALLHRGVTGHCNTYQAFGITTNNATAATVKRRWRKMCTSKKRLRSTKVLKSCSVSGGSSTICLAL